MDWDRRRRAGRKIMAEVATQPATATGTVVAQPAAGGLTRRMPTSTLGMAGDWSCPPTADRKLDASKKDFTLCGALCCSWPASSFFETMVPPVRHRRFVPQASPTGAPRPAAGQHRHQCP